MLNYPNAVYTMTFKQFLELEGDWFTKNMVLPNEPDSINEEFQKELISRWKWYEISGETPAIQKEFLLDTLTEWADYYIQKLHAYYDLMNIDVSRLGGKKQREVTENKDSDFQNSGSNTGTQAVTSSNTTTNTGTQMNVGLAPDNETVTTHVDLPNKQISPTDYFEYPSNLDKVTSSSKSTRTDNLSEAANGNSQRTDNLAHQERNVGTSERTMSDTYTDYDELLASMEKFYKLVSPIMHQFADKFGDCFLHLYA